MNNQKVTTLQNKKLYDDNIKTYGAIVLHGVKYALCEIAHIEQDENGKAYFKASAMDENGLKYNVIWQTATDYIKNNIKEIY